MMLLSRWKSFSGASIEKTHMRIEPSAGRQWWRWRDNNYDVVVPLKEFQWAVGREYSYVYLADIWVLVILIWELIILIWELVILIWELVHSHMRIGHSHMSFNDWRPADGQVERGVGQENSYEIWPSAGRRSLKLIWDLTSCCPVNDDVGGTTTHVCYHNYSYKYEHIYVL